jgi:hypothetical protein
MELLNTQLQFSTASCYFIHLKYKYLPQHHVLQDCQSMSLVPSADTTNGLHRSHTFDLIFNKIQEYNKYQFNKLYEN